MRVSNTGSSAFSLVELSIVLVILGLLTGGILAGQSLIRASELRSVTTEYQRYVTAAQTFRDKYFAIPGEMAGATRFWTRQVNAAHCVTNSAAAVGTPGTCDGNGNGIINISSVVSQSAEGYQFWRQLALAGLIEGSYTGLGTATHGFDATPGSNIPTSKISNAGWVLSSSAGGLGNTDIYEMDYGNLFSFGTKVSTSVYMRGMALRPEELWNIDTKLDDGRPAYGNVIAMFWGNAANTTRCTINAVDENDLNSDYNLVNPNISCGAIFRNLF